MALLPICPVGWERTQFQRRIVPWDGNIANRLISLVDSPVGRAVTIIGWSGAPTGVPPALRRRRESRSLVLNSGFEDP